MSVTIDYSPACAAKPAGLIAHGNHIAARPTP